MVESVVNAVGVDLNTASPALLTHVAGVGPKLAANIVAYRDQNGAFKSRGGLRDVSGLGPKAYEQSAGFMRIRDGVNPLDASAIHPESYSIAEAVLARAGLSSASAIEERRPALEALTAKVPPEALATELGCGLPTLKDILEQLVRPGRDPREEAPAPILRSDVLKMEDLVTGPYVKKARELRLLKKPQKGQKLNSTQVMLLKKKIFDPNRKTRLKILAKQFGISEMQLYRIKSGENWSHIKIDD